MSILLALLCLGVCSAQELAVEPYTGHYTGAIMPTPREAKYLEGAWELADCAAGASSSAIVLCPQPSAAEELAAEAIATRIGYLSGGLRPQIGRDGKMPRDAKTYIALGMPATNRFLQGHGRDCEVTVPEQSEGYAIASYAHEKGLQGVLLMANDAAGVTFAAQSLVQMIRRTGDRVVLHPVQVRDWPAYRLRSFKPGGGTGPDDPAASMARWAPTAKFNCMNICYTTMGVDKWVDPSEEYRALVQGITADMRARGLDCMPFVNPYYLWKEHIETADEADLEKLFEACRINMEAGGTRVMLCLDDFASEPNWAGPELYTVRSEKDREKFDDDLAAVNVAMVNELWSRIKAAYPGVKLYVVLPYYWSPDSAYREAGEKYVRDAGAGIDPDVTIVWTGPRVRSAHISQTDVEYYQGLLGGRRAMLWDNTIYMHHNPTHYFLDTFRTVFAERFWDLTSGEVHLNAGHGEAYKCGLLAAADYLWNPEAYEPETSLRRAIAMVAGPEAVEDLLAFRDAFYEVYDHYSGALGSPQAFLERAKKMEKRAFDDAALQQLRMALDTERELAAKVAATCDNSGLVAEVRDRVESHGPYLEAMEVISALPPLSEQDVANTVPNPGAEELDGSLPAHWGMYTGAGRATMGLGEPHSGEHSAKLTATELHDWGGGRTSINVALMAGPCNGFTGPQAPEVTPFSGYHYSFWVKGTAPRVVVRFVTWGEDGEVGSRSQAIMRAEPFAATDEWAFHSGSFVVPMTAARGALKICIEGYNDEGAGLGEICVDDVYVGMSREQALQGAGQ